ncbi:M15 family metallopeptidase [Hyphomicrobiaceae bacterium 22]|uniref:D-alanyl-D-alanine dipeptidase n=2 Tax=Prosthecodimorpha staleyi TaxID=2840188 RepID=A0A947GBB7_9HYPH|nr:M15 family metallopeptidase [Prosthecodimorpha staleyi]
MKTAGLRTVHSKDGAIKAAVTGGRVRSCSVPAAALAGVVAIAALPAGAAEDLPPGFVRLADIDASIRQDMRYAGAQNFVGRPVAGYEKPVCILTRAAATALSQAQKRLAADGLSLKVYDCYRPARAVADFGRWARSPDQATKAEFYPAVDKARLFGHGYISGRSGHSRGSTVDLTLVPAGAPGLRGAAGPHGPCTAPEAERAPDDSLDMGTAFDCFDPRAATGHPAIAGAPANNRARLAQAMQAAGFVGYAKEWWHFTLSPEPFPETYFDFPVR